MDVPITNWPTLPFWPGLNFFLLKIRLMKGIMPKWNGSIREGEKNDA
jgi:hypothetical protein